MATDKKGVLLSSKGNFVRKVNNIKEKTVSPFSKNVSSKYAEKLSKKGALSYSKDNISCYIKNLITGTTIEFDLIPEEFSETNVATYDQHNIRGRSSPIQGYSNSGPRNISYMVQIHDDCCTNGIVDTVNKLRALSYPEYGGSIVPPKCYIRFGDMLSIKAVVINVNVTWRKPYRNGTFINADVSLDFIEIIDKPRSASEVEGGKYE